MRDPAVLAVYAVHLSPVELDAVLAGASIVRPYWPPVSCRGAVVGLHAAGAVVGEALLAGVQAAEGGGGVRWTFGPVTRYLRALPCARSRGMAAPMPHAPVGTLTLARDWDSFK
jgi:hypothetical protein